MRLKLPRALVVDDDQPFGEALSRWLSELGYQPFVATSAAQGVALLKNGHFDVLLLDLQLPDLSGQSIIRRLNHAGAAIPVIVVSGTSEMDDLVQAWSENAAGFLRKPFRLDVLAATLRKVLKRGSRWTAAPSRVPLAPSALAAAASSRILVADHEALTREALERGLRGAGYEVVSTGDGEQALALAMARRPHVIVADLKMPRLDVQTLVRQATAEDVEAAVIMMSQCGNVKEVVQVLRDGAVDYLEKPFSNNDLLAAVRRALDAQVRRRREAQTGVALGTPSASTARGSSPRQDPTRTALPPRLPTDPTKLIRDLENQYIAAALELTAGNKRAAAELLGLHRTTLVEKLRRRPARTGQD